MHGRFGLTFGSSFGAVRLHRHVSVQMIERAICLFAAIPTTLVHPLNLFVTPSGTLVLLRTRDRNKRVHGGKRVTALSTR